MTRSHRHRPFCTLALLTLAARTIGASTAVLAGEWPQILGPHRNGIANNEQLASRWPEGGPRTVWQRSVGDGVAGVAVADGRAVLFHRVGNDEVVEAMDAATGEVLWKRGFPTRFRADVSTAGHGPRCVPLIHDGSVYLFGAGGDLHCLSMATAEEKWSRAAFKEYQAPNGYFGAGSTPIIDGGKLLVNVGGSRAGAGIVALDLKNGQTVWRATDEQASYSAPTAATIDGLRHVIFVARYNVVSIDPESGAVRFRFPFGMRGPTVNAATPLVIDGHVFVSASYGVGAVFARIGATKAETVWAKDDTMSSQYPTCVYKDGYLYGIDGRQDVGVATLRCLQPATGRVQWTKAGFGMASLILADEKLVIMKTDGHLELAEPSPDGYRPLARALVFENASSDRPALALPALANGLLYVRDTQTLKCLDLRR